LRAVLTAPSDRGPALDELNTILGELSCAPAVDMHGEVHLRSDHPQTQLCLDLAGLAIDASGLPAGRVHRCANPRCVLLFYDTTKSGTRRWHDMATCGNQAKAVAHHARTREQRFAHGP
jgi:predicted RNA-binding Zn ribbon-like protein